MFGNARRRASAALGCGLALATASSTAIAATITGDIAAPSVVWVSTGVPAAPVAAEMRNVDKTFVPDVLVIPAGSVVRFPNDDPFFHSIYSNSDVDPFDVGFYSTGPGKEFAFLEPGVVDVRCHIHGQMHATIVVVDGPWAQSSGPSFEIDGVPPGPHVLHVWDLTHGERTMRIGLRPDETFRLPAGI
jgi:plastocyanin